MISCGAIRRNLRDRFWPSFENTEIFGGKILKFRSGFLAGICLAESVKAFAGNRAKLTKHKTLSMLDGTNFICQS